MISVSLSRASISSVPCRDPTARAVSLPWAIAFRLSTSSSMRPISCASGTIGSVMPKMLQIVRSWVVAVKHRNGRGVLEEVAGSPLWRCMPRLSAGARTIALPAGGRTRAADAAPSPKKNSSIWRAPAPGPLSAKAIRRYSLRIIFHPLFPERPRLRRYVVVDAAAELARPRRLVEPRHLLLELDALDGAASGRRVGHRRFLPPLPVRLVPCADSQPGERRLRLRLPRNQPSRTPRHSTAQTPSVPAWALRSRSRWRCRARRAPPSPRGQPRRGRR